MKYLFSIIFLLSFLCENLKAQNLDHKNIIKPIQTLFEGMEKNDSSMVRKVFSEDISFLTVSRDKNIKTFLKAGDVQQFLNTIGSPKEVALREVISNIKVQVDGDFASVWCDYSFYLGKEFHHCGIDQFLLINSDTGWKIRQIVDTRRTENCNQ